jgi:hypothetical protein
MNKIIYLYLLLSFSALSGLAQAPNQNSSSGQGIVQEAYNSLNVANNLNGKQYVLKEPFAVESQFYNDENPDWGWIVYDGIRYDHIYMQYDLVIQKVVLRLESATSEQYISIDSDKLTAFQIGQVYFEYVTVDSMLSPGIYEVAYRGPTSSLLIQRTKTRLVKTTDQIRILYRPYDNHYVQNQYGTFKVDNKKSFLEAYNNDPQVKAVIKRSKLSFGKSRLDNDITQALKIIDANETVSLK